MTTNDAKRIIMEAIKNQHIAMRSRIYFSAQTVLFFMMSFFSMVVGIFVVSFLYFVLRGNGLLSLPYLGLPGTQLLLENIPWIGILVTLVSIAVFEIFALRYPLIYKRPLIYSLFGIIAIVASLGIIIAQTKFHEEVFELSQRGMLPGASTVYRGALRESKNVTIGEITTISNSDSITLLTRMGSTTHVLITEETRVPPQGLQVGQTVVVLGGREDTIITAKGIRPIDPERIMFPKGERPLGPNKNQDKKRINPPREILPTRMVY